MLRLLTAAWRLAPLLVGGLLAACGGGSEPGGAQPVEASGTLAAPFRCTIEVDESACGIEVSWTSANATTPRVLLDDQPVADGASGSSPLQVTHGVSVVALVDGTTTLASESIVTRCVGEADWDGVACRRVVTKITEFAPTPFTHDGEPVFLEVVMYRPMSAGPYPTVLFNHGSTGLGDNPDAFRTTFVSDTVVRFFTRRGWLVAFPQRRGRGQSGGLYDEGFTPDRSRYSCEPATALAGAERALDDLDVLLDWMRAYPGVDIDRVIGAGFSRGGVLALVHGATRPGRYQAVVNFVGGWMSDLCPRVDEINPVLFERAGAFAGESLWLYGENDQVYRTAHSRNNHAVFVAAGGKGAFLTYTRAPGLNGHFVMNDPELWADDLDAFLSSIPSL